MNFKLYLVAALFFVGFAFAAASASDVESAVETEEQLREQLIELAKFLNYGNVSEDQCRAQITKLDMSSLQKKHKEYVEESIKRYKSFYTRNCIENRPDKSELLQIPTLQLAKFLNYVWEHGGTADASVDKAMEILGNKASTETHKAALGELFTVLQSRLESVEKDSTSEFLTAVFRWNFKRGRPSDAILKKVAAFLYSAKKIEDWKEFMCLYEEFYCLVNKCETMPEDVRAELAANDPEQIGAKFHDYLKGTACKEFATQYCASLWGAQNSDSWPLIKQWKYLKEHLFVDATFEEVCKINPGFVEDYEHKDFLNKASIIVNFPTEKLEQYAKELNMTMPVDENGAEGLYKLRTAIAWKYTIEDLKGKPKKSPMTLTTDSLLLIGAIVAAVALVIGFIVLDQRKKNKIVDLEAKN